MEQGNLPRTRALPRLPRHGKPRVSRRVPGSVCLLCPSIATPCPLLAVRLSTGMAEALQLLEGPAGTWGWAPRPSLGGSRTAPPQSSPACGTFCGLRGAREVSEQQNKGLVPPLQAPLCAVPAWSSRGDALGLIRTKRVAKAARGRTCLHLWWLRRLELLWLCLQLEKSPASEVSPQSRG